MGIPGSGSVHRILLDNKDMDTSHVTPASVHNGLYYASFYLKKMAIKTSNSQKPPDIGRTVR